MISNHSFHIPVMGIGYTLDTPIKVSHLGIDSVLSLVDDSLIERLRKLYCGKFNIPYQEIGIYSIDYRAERITSYLNLMNEIVEKKFEDLKNSAFDKKQEIKDYFSMLPDSSTIKQEFKKITSKYFNVNELKTWLKENLSMGSIDVNIMTKIDKDNYFKKEKLPIEYNDAHAALRGFAKSNLNSSVILSAGMNPRLYSYIEQFEDFYPNEQGEIKKKIVLKVSDYRSALIQGKFFAKKGLWVSEYRIESGLNCGGHAFATDGFLMGPILADFRDNKKELSKSIHEIIHKALSDKNRVLPKAELSIKITAQGGVGTAEEHQFLLDHYEVDSVGWGTPFLLVPEVASIDESTVNKLIEAKEDDLYLSYISPLGVPFNSLKGNTKDVEKLSLINKGKAGSTCPKKYVALNNEFTEKGICPASRHYQQLKIKELDEKSLNSIEYKKEFSAIVDKSCICVGLGTSTLLVNQLDTGNGGNGVSVCPSPNLAYFSKRMSLKNMVDHIYGKANMISRTDRPNMFVKELKIYIDYLKNKLVEAKGSNTIKQEKYFMNFVQNLKEGLHYYQSLFGDMKDKFHDSKSNILSDLETCNVSLQLLCSDVEKRSLKTVAARYPDYNLKHSAKLRSNIKN